MKDVFAIRFREERERAGLTQEDIATVCRNRSGEPLSSSAVAQWEQPDGTRPGYENLVAAARRINTSIDYLTGITDRLYEARETTAQYDGLPDDALRLARRWGSLPPSAREAVQRLLDVMSKMSAK